MCHILSREVNQFEQMTVLLTNELYVLDLQNKTRIPDPKVLIEKIICLK